ncbi:surfeit locus 1 family protein [Marmoricola sp. OAE513]|uniref:SURF1 family protein n=1 Tax=Marmoricola sp. OAE513 TaxID=2817894 RepID=UPI001AE6C54C
MFTTLLRPKFWAGHLAMIVCVSAAVGLGIWQLDAWHTRRADAARDISNLKPVGLGTVMDGDSSFPGRSVGRPVSFAGTWLADSTLYIADRYVGKKRGYWVVTPVRVDGSQSVMPVVRGWSAKAESVAPTGPVEVTGWLQASEGSGPVDDDPHDDVIPMMRLASLVEHVDADLYSAYVVARDVTGQGGPEAGGLRSVSAAAVPDVSGFTALRNLLYAIEWWVFGAFAFFVWARWCADSWKDEGESEVDPAAAAEVEPA